MAKGTIYLHFADKETLFQELIRLELSPVVGALEHASHAEIRVRELAARLVDIFVREIFETRRKDVIRLVISEGPRFPKLAEFYYREVISKVMDAIRAILRHAVERGELKDAHSHHCSRRELSDSSRTRRVLSEILFNGGADLPGIWA